MQSVDVHAVPVVDHHHRVQPGRVVQPDEVDLERLGRHVRVDRVVYQLREGTERPLVAGTVAVQELRVGRRVPDVRGARHLAVGETVSFCWTPLSPVVGVSIAMERERQPNDNLADGARHRRERVGRVQVDLDPGAFGRGRVAGRGRGGVLGAGGGPARGAVGMAVGLASAGGGCAVLVHRGRTVCRRRRRRRGRGLHAVWPILSGGHGAPSAARASAGTMGSSSKRGIRLFHDAIEDIIQNHVQNRKTVRRTRLPGTFRSTCVLYEYL